MSGTRGRGGQPGTRIVSHAFDIEADGRTIYFWVVPEKPGRSAR